MNQTRNTIFLIAVLLALLSVLAFLQFRWLSQISLSEKEQMQNRLQNDTEHFAKDFDETIQSAYFPFQITVQEIRQTDFAARYQEWFSHAAYPDLIDNFTYVSKNNEKLLFDRDSHQFVKTGAGENFDDLKNNFTPVDQQNLILRMPVYEQAKKVGTIKIIESHISKTISDSDQTAERTFTREMDTPEAAGYLLIKLNEETIKNKILQTLNDKYFSDGTYKIDIVKDDKTTVFQTRNIENSDASVKMFSLTPNNLAFFVNSNLMNSLGTLPEHPKVIIDRRIDAQTIKTSGETSNKQIKITVAGNASPQIIQTAGGTARSEGIWTLNVQHVAGSLENSAANSLYKSLAISFGILFLLGASVAAVFISAQRAKIFAQKQVDFVSSVSHEFRTPLAVIYSAGENLADGVAKEENQVSRYGDLIKSEGRKLTAMIEQILDFAGANSGKKKYDQRETDVCEIIETALAECRPQLRDFTVETELADTLPSIFADQTALKQTIQNLIANSAKYSNGVKYLKISAKTVEQKINISIEDKGLGIAQRDLKHIFEPFYRAKSVVDEQIHGSGLGLSLVKKTVEAHKGKVEVESEIGKGTKFTIQFPAAKN